MKLFFKVVMVTAALQMTSMANAQVRNSGVSEFKVAGNLYFKSAQHFPSGLKLLWNNMRNDVVTKDMSTGQVSTKYSDLINVIEIDGKAVLTFGLSSGCNYYADIVIPVARFVLSEKAQSFQLSNFRQAANDVCSYVNPYIGKSSGSITLRQDAKGTLYVSYQILHFYTPTLTQLTTITETGCPLGTDLKEIAALAAGRSLIPEMDKYLTNYFYPFFQYVPHSVTGVKSLPRTTMSGFLEYEVTVEQMEFDRKKADYLVKLVFTPEMQFVGLVTPSHPFTCVMPAYITGTKTFLPKAQRDQLAKIATRFAYENVVRYQNSKYSYTADLSVLKEGLVTYSTETTRDVVTGYDYFRNSNGNYDQIPVMEKRSHRELGTVPGVENPTSHPVLIRGFIKRAAGFGITIRDGSIEIPPKSSTGFFNIGPTFDYQNALLEKYYNVGSLNPKLSAKAKEKLKENTEYGYQYEPEYSITVGDPKALMLGNSAPLPGELRAGRLDANTLQILDVTNSSDIVLSKGDVMTFRTTGSITVGLLDTRGIGPGGSNKNNNDRLYDKAPYAALLGRIDKGEWQLLGEGGSFTAPATGRLELSVNNKRPIGDRRGSLKLVYAINKSLPAEQTKPAFSDQSNNSADKAKLVTEYLGDMFDMKNNKLGVALGSFTTDSEGTIQMKGGCAFNNTLGVTWEIKGQKPTDMSKSYSLVGVADVYDIERNGKHQPIAFGMLLDVSATGVKGIFILQGNDKDVAKIQGTFSFRKR